MSFAEAVRTVLGKYATFTGRAARPEYWWWVLFMLLVNLVTNTLDSLIIAPALGMPSFGDQSAQPLTFLMGLALFLPCLAVGVRRLHDTDRSGWWLLIAFIPLIGALILLWWFVQPGTDGPNQFGPEDQMPRDAAL